ncbi:MAG: hypothetical protein MKZ76_04250 [Pedosphaera sp.]|nr:hypothetical protein [Pedosphaera sp.]
MAVGVGSCGRTGGCSTRSGEGGGVICTNGWVGEVGGTSRTEGTRGSTLRLVEGAKRLLACEGRLEDAI